MEYAALDYDSLSGPVNVEVNVNCNLIWEYGYHEQ